MQTEKASAEALGIPEGLKGWGLLIGFEKKGLHKNNSDLSFKSGCIGKMNLSRKLYISMKRTTQSNSCRCLVFPLDNPEFSPQHFSYFTGWIRPRSKKKRLKRTACALWGNPRKKSRSNWSWLCWQSRIQESQLSNAQTYNWHKKTLWIGMRSISMDGNIVPVQSCFWLVTKPFQVPQNPAPSPCCCFAKYFCNGPIKAGQDT